MRANVEQLRMIRTVSAADFVEQCCKSLEFVTRVAVMFFDDEIDEPCERHWLRVRLRLNRRGLRCSRSRWVFRPVEEMQHVLEFQSVLLANFGERLIAAAAIINFQRFEHPSRARYLNRKLAYRSSGIQHGSLPSWQKIPLRTEQLEGQKVFVQVCEEIDGSRQLRAKIFPFARNCVRFCADAV